MRGTVKVMREINLPDSLTLGQLSRRIGDLVLQYGDDARVFPEGDETGVTLFVQFERDESDWEYGERRMREAGLVQDT